MIEYRIIVFIFAFVKVLRFTKTSPVRPYAFRGYFLLSVLFCIEFEKDNGTITVDMIREMYGNDV